MNLSTTRRLGTIAAIWVVVLGLNLALLPSRYMPHIQVELLQPMTMPLVVRGPATLEAKKSFTLKGEFDGPVQGKNFKEGQAIEKGQWLLKIGRDHIQLDYTTKSDAVKNAKADLNKAKKDFKLQKALFKRQAVARSSVEDAERAQDHAEQALRTAIQAFQLEEERWNKNQPVAPFAGTIVKDSLGDETNVVTGKEILTLADLSGFSVKMRVDELDISQVREGQAGSVRIGAFDKTWLPATVSQIGGQTTDAGSPDVTVTLLLTDPRDLHLRPGLSADARIVIGQTDPILSVPLTAVANQDGRTHVWVVSRSGRLQSRIVSIGKSNPDRVEITQGLSAGERVCVQNDPRFADGLKVDAHE